jgi:PTH1 family peptidyl-tRNA hydrolase
MKSFQGMIAGLGNPGEKYSASRHNFGFMAVEALMDEAGEKACEKADAGGDCLARACRIVRSRGPWLVLMPLTYMNLSGAPVARARGRFRIPDENIVVVHDELDLPLGRMKLKFGGGAAGHNGVASVMDQLGSGDFYRLRLGIGRPVHSRQAADYVLQDFAAEELPLAEETAKAAARGLKLFILRGPEHATRFINGFKPSNGL